VPGQPHFVVMGAYLTDILITTSRLPGWGDDLKADAISTSLGGKALNQATVLARHGAPVTALGAVGDDDAGRRLRAVLERDGIDTSAMSAHPIAPTSTCLVFTHPDGSNAMVWRVPDELVLTEDYVDSVAGRIAAADALLVTVDVPPATVRAAIRAAKAAGTRVVVNPAPLPEDPADIVGIPWAEADLVVPNEAEARLLLPKGDRGRQADAAELPRLVAEALGVPFVCVTLAERGCVTWDGDRTATYAAHQTNVADVTAASDAFTPTLALHLLAGVHQHIAVERALRAAAITVSRVGTYDALPRRDELAGQPGLNDGDSGLATEPTAEITGRSASSA
jgi:ribokinase